MEKENNMWLLSWLSSWLIHLITLAGFLGLLASFVLEFIPFVGKYKLPLQVVSVLVLVFGMWFEGGLSNEAKWNERVLQMQVEFAKKEAQSSEANVVIQTKVVEKIKKIKEVQFKIKEVIKEHETTIDAECKIVPEVINILNSAAVNEIEIMIEESK